MDKKNQKDRIDWIDKIDRIRPSVLAGSFPGARPRCTRARVFPNSPSRCILRRHAAARGPAEWFMMLDALSCAGFDGSRDVMRQPMLVKDCG